MVEFQARVRKNYDKLMDERWKIFVTDSRTADQVFNEVFDFVMKTIASHDNQPLSVLWPMIDGQQ